MRRWLLRQSGDFAAAYVHENPGGTSEQPDVGRLHSHLLVHVPRRLNNAFAEKLPAWFPDAADRPHGIDISASSALSRAEKLRYMSKGAPQPVCRTRYGKRHAGGQGYVPFKRLGVSQSISQKAREEPPIMPDSPREIDTAFLSPANASGAYAVEVPSLGLRLASERYPVNRMCRVLAERGLKGRLGVTHSRPGTSPPTLALIVDIEANAATKLTEESRDGFQHRPWRPKDIAALMERVVDSGMEAGHSLERPQTTEGTRNNNRPPTEASAAGLTADPMQSTDNRQGKA